MRVRFCKAFLHRCCRRFAKQAKDYDPQAAENEARDNLIQIQPAILFPDDNRHRANNHSRQRAVTCHTRPHHRKQDNRSKCRAESSLGVAHQPQHTVIGIRRQRNGDQRYHQHHHSPYPYQLLLAGAFTQKSLI